ncbi:MAG TPA: aminotransferase class V-fold PLP-dependent enzyme, partial [Byssovorax sp.]
MPSSLLSHWTLEPEVAFLNHGSFGACPRPVLAAQAAVRERMEREPVRFFMQELEPLLDAAREAVAAFVGADAAGTVFVANATMGVNAVVRSLDLAPGDDLVTTTHAYNACKNALEYVAARAGASVVVADVPFPLASDDDVISAVLAKVGARTRLALLDHVTSPTGLVFPIARLVKEIQARGVDVLVDGAHAPGMLPLDLEALGAAYYTGNLHKWVCAPKAVAFLHVREDRRDRVRPTVISHGANTERADRPRLWLEFDWMGTFDPSSALAVPEALRFLPTLAGGAWSSVYASNREKVLAARARLCSALDVAAPAPASMIGSLAAVPLPEGFGATRAPCCDGDPLQRALHDRVRVQVPVTFLPP